MTTEWGHLTKRIAELEGEVESVKASRSRLIDQHAELGHRVLRAEATVARVRDLVEGEHSFKTSNRRAVAWPECYVDGYKRARADILEALDLLVPVKENA